MQVVPGDVVPGDVSRTSMSSQSGDDVQQHVQYHLPYVISCAITFCGLSSII